MHQRRWIQMLSARRYSRSLRRGEGRGISHLEGVRVGRGKGSTAIGELHFCSIFAHEERGQMEHGGGRQETHLWGLVRIGIDLVNSRSIDIQIRSLAAFQDRFADKLRLDSSQIEKDKTYRQASACFMMMVRRRHLQRPRNGRHMASFISKRVSFTVAVNWG